jgi:hypothetical protein
MESLHSDPAVSANLAVEHYVLVIIHIHSIEQCGDDMIYDMMSTAVCGIIALQKCFCISFISG